MSLLGEYDNIDIQADKVVRRNVFDINEYAPVNDDTSKTNDNNNKCNVDATDKTPFQIAHINGIYIIIGALITGILTGGFGLKFIMGIPRFQTDAYKELSIQYNQLNENYDTLYNRYNEILLDEEAFMQSKLQLEEYRNRLDELTTKYNLLIEEKEILIGEKNELLSTIDLLNQNQTEPFNEISDLEDDKQDIPYRFSNFIEDIQSFELNELILAIVVVALPIIVLILLIKAKRDRL